MQQVGKNEFVFIPMREGNQPDPCEFKSWTTHIGGRLALSPRGPDDEPDRKIESIRLLFLQLKYFS